MKALKFFLCLGLCCLLAACSVPEKRNLALLGKQVQTYATSHGFYPIPAHATGLIIDARHLKLKTTYNPEIYAPNGARLYPIQIPDMNFILEKGLVAYTYNFLFQARSHTRAGKSPLILRALKAKGDYAVVLNQSDSQTLQQKEAQTHFLKKFQVVFLLLHE